MSDGQATYCVTLVHGTLAPGAPWTREGSVLRKTIEHTLKSPVVFVPLEWGGANSQAARRAGGHKLTEQLLQNCRQYPDAAHFIISHSHGGNVSLAALQSPDVSSRLSGLICLATPFLHYERRRYVLILFLLLLGLFGCVALFVVGFLTPRPIASDDSIQTYVRDLFTALGGSTQAWHPLLVLLFIGALSLGLSWWGVRRLGHWIERKQAHAKECYPVPEKIPFRVMGISLPFDEARLLLRGLWRLAEVPTSIGHPVFVGAVIAAGVWSQVEYFPQAANPWTFSAISIWMWFWTFVLVSTGVLAVILLLQALMFLAVFVRGHPWGYGWEGWTTSWFGSVSAHEKPGWLRQQCDIPSISARHVRSEIKGWRPFRTLRHSVLYESPTVLREIALWMQKQAPPSAPQPPRQS